MKIDGGCRCGGLRYEAVVDPSKATICHCTDCQVTTGSARQRDSLPPKAQIWWRSAQPWVKELIGEDTMPTRDRQ